MTAPTAVQTARQPRIAFNVSTWLRQRVLERDNWTCLYCGWADPLRGPGLEVDHVVPRRAGGTAISTNLATACRSCNQRKGAGDEIRLPPGVVPARLQNRMQRRVAHLLAIEEAYEASRTAES